MAKQPKKKVKVPTLANARLIGLAFIEGLVCVHFGGCSDATLKELVTTERANCWYLVSDREGHVGQIGDPGQRVILNAFNLRHASDEVPKMAFLDCISKDGRVLGYRDGDGTYVIYDCGSQQWSRIEVPRRVFLFGAFSPSGNSCAVITETDFVEAEGEVAYVVWQCRLGVGPPKRVFSGQCRLQYVPDILLTNCWLNETEKGSRAIFFLPAPNGKGVTCEWHFLKP